MVQKANSYNYLEGRNETAIYQHMKPDGVIVEGNMKMTWDDDMFHINFELPLGMTDERYLQIFQSILQEITYICRYEADKESFERDIYGDDYYEEEESES